VQGRTFFWADLTTTEFKGLDPEKTIAILPVAATEQHGPHLPVVTDTAIAEGMIGLLKDRLPDDLSVLVLPTQSIGKSDEHLLSPGTLSLSTDTLLHVLLETAEGVHRAGLRKMILANSHGGNISVLAIAAREMRVRLNMLAVPTHWMWFGLPEETYDETEACHGIHAGDIETSLMLAFRGGLVRMDKAKNFVSSAIAMQKEFTHLSPAGTHGFGWIAQDLSPDGAVGDATKATAEKGRKTAEHQITEFIKLVRDMTAFPLNRLYAADADQIR
jgi:creatinine amidohydrolase